MRRNRKHLKRLASQARSRLCHIFGHHRHHCGYRASRLSAVERVAAEYGWGRQGTVGGLEKVSRSSRGPCTLADALSRYRELHSEGTTKAPGTAGFLDGNLSVELVFLTSEADIPLSLQQYLDIATQSDELSERILNGPNEFSRVGRSRALQPEGDDEPPASAASKDEVVSLLETLSALH